ncbi:hypothetical protein V2J09_009656 [Rumex salicifolius]
MVVIRDVVLSASNPPGAWSKGFQRACHYTLKQFRTEVLAFLKPHIAGLKAQIVCDSLGFSNNFWVEAIGASGGIIDDTTHFIYAKVDVMRSSYHLIVVHGPPTPNRKYSSRKSLISRGGIGGLMQDSAVFSQLISRRELIDMGLSGSKFTWRHCPAEAPTVSKRLDRFLMNIPARLCWEEASVRHLPVVRSDHNPLFLSLMPSLNSNTNRWPFRFEAIWLTHPECLGTRLALSTLREDLRHWNKETFGNIHYKKVKLLKRIQGIDVALYNDGPDRLLIIQNKLKAELKTILLQEELFWYQKSRSQWLRNWITEKGELKEMVVHYFTDLYTLHVANSTLVQLSMGGFPIISNTELMRLLAPFGEDEIWLYVRCTRAYKALGIDGFQPVFYHNCWTTVRDSVCSFIRNFFAIGSLSTEVNETIIHLTGKVANLEYVSQFRSISLCNVLYKMITKILAYRIQPLMSSLVGPM